MYRIIGADGREYGPISADQLRQWILEGRASAATRALAEGTTDWKPLGTFPEFSLLFTAPAATPSAAPRPAQRTNGFATTSLILGILSIIATCCCYGLPFNLLGLVFGIIAIIQIRSEPDRYSGEALAIGGIVLSSLSLVFIILVFLAAILGSVFDPGSHHHVYRL